MTAAVATGLLLAVAVVSWPVADRAAEVRRVLSTPAAPGPPGLPGAEDAGAGRLEAGVPDARRLGIPEDARGMGVPVDARRWSSAAALRELWRADPVEVFRQWRARRRSSSSLSGALALLEGVAPALEAGLPPAVAVRLSGASLGSTTDSGTARWVAQLAEACDQGGPIASVWRSWAAESESAELGFVAAAWQLSEVTGAPLADAVHRAVAALHQARERARRVHVAVAGPRATVLVLTVLPLTGPLFGLACGVTPSDLYLDSPISTGAALAGLGLIWVGRRWCRRLVDGAAAAGRGTSVDHGSRT
ncbi:type II secretion system F family protein [Intrasporangium sp. DVR]|uniref:type II secretion system F family protein n=1 Tax=Intrasporangium sp. DVR TaxID=3127867 RepID=UPI00313A58D7